MAFRVLMFGWEFPPFNSGGLGVACHGLAGALARQCAKIIFVLPRRFGVHADGLEFRFADDLKDRISFRSVPSLLTPYLTSERYGILRRRSGESLYGQDLFEEVARYRVAGWEIAARESFDVIHAHDWLSFGAGIEAKRVSGRPLIVHVHATEFDRTGGNGVNQDVYSLEREGMHAADAVITVSHYTKGLVMRHYGVHSDKVRVVHNGVETEGGGVNRRMRMKDFIALKRAGHPLVLFVGRITLQKGPEYFIRAAGRVLEFVPNAAFVMVGTGDMERQVMEEAAWLGISRHVFFTGFLRGEEIRNLYASADLLVMPSVSEPFGITPLESLSYGTPVIVSKQSGVSEILHHALKVDFWDVDEIANKIVSVLRYGSLQRCLGEYGGAEASQWTWERAASRCLEVYQSVMSY